MEKWSNNKNGVKVSSLWQAHFLWCDWVRSFFRSKYPHSDALLYLYGPSPWLCWAFIEGWLQTPLSWIGHLIKATEVLKPQSNIRLRSQAGERSASLWYSKGRGIVGKRGPRRTAWRFAPILFLNRSFLGKKTQRGQESGSGVFKNYLVHVSPEKSSCSPHSPVWKLLIEIFLN